VVGNQQLERSLVLQYMKNECSLSSVSNIGLNKLHDSNNLKVNRIISNKLIDRICKLQHSNNQMQKISKFHDY